MIRNVVVAVERKIVIEEQKSDMVKRRRLDEPKNRTANRFENAIDALQRDSGAKGPMLD